jgi:hypothetical protein
MSNAPVRQGKYVKLYACMYVLCHLLAQLKTIILLRFFEPESSQSAAVLVTIVPRHYVWHWTKVYLLWKYTHLSRN